MMVFGIPASASGVNLNEEGGIGALLSYCDEVGVDHVSIGPPVQDGKPDVKALVKLKERLNKVGLEVYAGGVFYAREGNFFDEAVRSQQLRQAIDLVRCYGEAKIEPVTLFCSLNSSQNPDEQKTRWKLATDFLRTLVDEAKVAEVRLAVHTLTNSVFNKYETVLQMFSDIPSDYLGVCYDVAIHAELDDDVPSNIKALKDKMPLMHLRTIGDVTPWRNFEVKDSRLQKAVPRAKQVNFPSVMCALVEARYDGILSLEHQHGPVAYARAVGYLKGVLEAVS